MDRKYWVFDLFGTLIGSEGAEKVYIDALNELYKGIEYWKVNAYVGVTDFGSADVCIAKSLEKFNLTVSDEQIEMFNEQWNHWKSLMRLEDGVIDVLRELKKRGCTLALVTNDNNLISDLVGKFDLEKYFDVVISSYKVGVAKPNPKIYELCAEKMGVTDFSEITMVGDKLDRDVEPPRALGMRGILYDPYEENMEFQPRISSLRELLN
ncbi:MAG TPA: HAD family hydrolase [Candidatus Magasanikbacteria bacterium]|nr:HAD family hydrolase [Candidatus Magasanikbacteria bacterium]